MRQFPFIRYIVIALLIILCAIFLQHFFAGMQSVKDRKVYAIYSILPKSAEMWIEWNNSLDIKECKLLLTTDSIKPCSEEIKKVILLSKDDNWLAKHCEKIVMSFHDIDNIDSRILFLKLRENTTEDKAIERIVSSLIPFPLKMKHVNSEEILIGMFSSGEFLCIYQLPGLLVLSKQEKLIANVIDIKNTPNNSYTPSTGKHYTNDIKLYVKKELKNVMEKDSLAQTRWKKFQGWKVTTLTQVNDTLKLAP